MDANISICIFSFDSILPPIPAFPERLSIARFSPKTWCEMVKKLFFFLIDNACFVWFEVPNEKRLFDAIWHRCRNVKICECHTHTHTHTTTRPMNLCAVTLMVPMSVSAFNECVSYGSETIWTMIKCNGEKCKMQSVGRQFYLWILNFKIVCSSLKYLIYLSLIYLDLYCLILRRVIFLDIFYWINLEFWWWCWLLNIFNLYLSIWF